MDYRQKSLFTLQFNDGFTLAVVHGGTAAKLIVPAPGAPFQNDSYYTIRGTTTTGQIIFKTSTPEEYSTATRVYQAVSSTELEANSYPEFYGITLTGINVTETSGDIILSLNEVIDELSGSGLPGQLVFVDTSENDKLVLRGTSGAQWNKNLELLSYTSKNTKEIYPFGWDGFTYYNDNWITATGGVTNSLDTFIPNSALIGNTGAPVGSSYANAITLVNQLGTGGITKSIQPVLNILGDNKNLRIPFLLQDYSPGKTANLITGSGPTMGSCFIASIPDPRKQCVDFVSKTYCDSIGGTWDDEPCNLRDELLEVQTACCLYDYDTNGIICINTWPIYCLEWMGVVGNVKCNIYEGILNRCSDLPDMCFSCLIGKCCFKGRCIPESEYNCLLNYPGAVWFGETC